MVKANQDIRSEIKNAGLTLWQIGKAWKGINEVSTVRRFRIELSDIEKNEIRKVIVNLVKPYGN